MSVGGKGEGEDGVRMILEDGDAGVVFQAPEPDRPVATTGGEQAAIRGAREGKNKASVTLEAADAGLGFQAEQADSIVVPASGKLCAAGDADESFAPGLIQDDGLAGAFFRRGLERVGKGGRECHLGG